MFAGGIYNIIYAGGKLIAETQGWESENYYHIFILSVYSGQILSHHDFNRYSTSCAPPILARGRIFSGDLIHQQVNVLQLGIENNDEWLGAFGDLQLNQMAVPDRYTTTLYNPITPVRPRATLRPELAHGILVVENPFDRAPHRNRLVLTVDGRTKLTLKP